MPDDVGTILAKYLTPSEQRVIMLTFYLGYTRKELARCGVSSEEVGASLAKLRTVPDFRDLLRDLVPKQRVMGKIHVPQPDET